MATSALPTTLPGIPSGFDASKINLYGNEFTPDIEKWQKSVDDAATALEQRYENPNWFKVAAGFFKPQLGGFAASLGSASQALGENLEKQRESQLPVAQMRAQVAQSKIAMAQRQKAADLAQALTKKPGGLTADDVADVAHRDEDRGKIAQAQFVNQQSLRKEIMEAHAAGRSDAELAAQYGPAFTLLYPTGTPKVATIPLPAPVAPGAAPGAAPDAAPGAAPVQSLPPRESNFTQAEWDAMPLAAQNKAIAALGAANTELSFKTLGQYRDLATQAQPQIERLKTMRELAAPEDPKLAAEIDKAFNILGGDDAVSLGGKALSEGRLTDRLANIDNLLVQAGIKTPEARRRIAELKKLINEQNANTGSEQSITDQQTALRGASNPSLDNPRAAFISLTDALAHTAKNKQELYDILEGRGPDKKKYHAPDFVGSDAYKANKLAFVNRHKQIFDTTPTSKTPDFYFPGTASAAPATAAATRVSPSTPSASGSTRSRLEERLNRAVP